MSCMVLNCLDAGLVLPTCAWGATLLLLTPRSRLARRDCPSCPHAHTCDSQAGRLLRRSFFSFPSRPMPASRRAALCVVLVPRCAAWLFCAALFAR
eukprot:5822820-Pleurochrysis_carterae.AAC.1